MSSSSAKNGGDTTSEPIHDDGEEVRSSAAKEAADQPLPRPARQPRRDKEDRGLPPDAEIAKLAKQYLETQAKLWPAVAKAGVIAEPVDTIVNDMVEDFKRRHRTGIVDVQPVRELLTVCGKLGGDYNRFSCDNSSPSSIIDQMVKALEKARQEERFIPWAYVFCDYSVSGLTASRQGYTSYKSVLEAPNHLIDTTYVDDFTRASRDEIEWWRLAYLSKRLKKRMIGASDGFDLSGVHWDMMITLFGLLSRLFIKSLREKVNRGMRGAARRRTCLGKQSLGFTRCASRDDSGAIVKGADDRPIYKPCIDPNTCEHRKLLFDLFVNQKWSFYRIAKHFNQLKIDGWAAWTESGIKKLLWSATAVGVFIWNRNRREYDREKEKWILLQNPRSEWEVYYDRNLAIVSIELWAAARKRLLAIRTNSPLTGRKRSRNQISATTLFSGTLVCDYCGKEILLARSTSKYKVMGCPNGRLGAHGCRLSCTKSTRIIEKCLLDYLQKRLLSDEAIGDLVGKANAYLAEEAGKPRTDTARLKASIREKETAIKRKFNRMETTENEDLIQAYEKNIAELQKEVNQLKSQLREIETRDVPAPAPLNLESVKAYLADIPALLNQEIPAAAEVIRDLTGPIRISQDAEPGKRGAKWIATFTPNLLGLLRQIAKEKDCPDSITLEFLCSRIWITPEPVAIPIEITLNCERIAEKVAKYLAKGASPETIAGAVGETAATVRQTIEMLRTGERPKAKPPGRRTGRGNPKKKDLDPAEIVRLRHEQNLSFKKIAARFGVGSETVKRAYDKGNPAAAKAAAESGGAPKRGRYTHLDPSVFAEIKSRLDAGDPPAKIALELNCGVSTVYRVRRKSVTKAA